MSAKYEKYKKLALCKHESILNRLNIEHEVYNNSIKLLCPIHGSTDIGSSSIRMDDGCWTCWSYNCNKKYGSNILGLIKGSLEKIRQRQVTWADVYQFIDDDQSVGITWEPKVVSKELKIFDKSVHPPVTIPSSYFIKKRNFTSEILKEFEVGDCKTGMYRNRAIVPVYHINDEYLGFSARSHFEVCVKCKYYHSPYQACITEDYKYKNLYRKWLHKAGMKKTLTMYNINRVARAKTHKVTIVEGASCVWRLHSYGVWGVATLGAQVEATQVNLLKNLNITDIILASDNDAAGNKFKMNFIQKYNDVFNIHLVTLTQKDITEMNDEDIKQNILRKWEKI